ncbi:PEP-CTERM sorting domain-containing protein [Thiobacillus sp. 65-1402]|uniref:PEP-CTERM sorting domain-containing protein n=1 Tax=Thiobacillus sp. 65-1402 TaxID=1895861 RepID=UPI00086DF396|nr:PEP-CTERM sorting domain-containing protein [Thiobacillus sp. 65-1402]ODU00665.1 MAG: hypothetical protein ABS89_08580 [Thiobacillus sp. SCN 63-1177]OJW97908.1 MAG: hypothetical protein BGO62_00535 [Thiobacillus sp. 65-1402]
MHNTTIRSAQLLLAAISFAFSMATEAATTLYSVGGGWFSDAGEHIEMNSIYAVGGGLDGYTRNNFFLFDLSGVSGPITTATLRLYNPDTSDSPSVPYGYTSSDPTETFALFDVSTDFFSEPTGGTHLVGEYEVGSVAGQSIFNDLGSGQSYGTYTASLADNGHFVEINLNASGLAALNAASGIFGIGGSITTLDGMVNRESLFVSSFLSFPGPNGAQLVVSSVPEPSETALFIAGLGLVGLTARRRAARGSQGRGQLH